MISFTATLQLTRAGGQIGFKVTIQILSQNWTDNLDFLMDFNVFNLFCSRYLVRSFVSELQSGNAAGVMLLVHFTNIFSFGIDLKFNEI